MSDRLTLGIVSDTHDRLDPRVETHFHGVHRILHAGDVCQPSVVARLAGIAPVTVARGNNDLHPAWRETEFVEIGTHRLLVEHIVQPDHPSPSFRTRLRVLRPTVVIFGHTHAPFCRHVDGILYLNPGSAGASRAGVPRSVVLLHLENGTPHPEFLTLGP